MAQLILNLPDEVRLGQLIYREYNGAWTVFLCATDPKLEPYIHGYATKYSIEEAVDAAVADFHERKREREAYLSSDLYHDRLAKAPKGISGASTPRMEPPEKLADLF